MLRKFSVADLHWPHEMPQETVYNSELALKAYNPELSPQSVYTQSLALKVYNPELSPQRIIIILCCILLYTNY